MGVHLIKIPFYDFGIGIYNFTALDQFGEILLCNAYPPPGNYKEAYSALQTTKGQFFQMGFFARTLWTAMR